MGCRLSLQHGARFARAVRAPARWAEEPAQRVAGLADQVLGDSDPLVERDADEVEGGEVADDPVAAGLSVQLWLEGAEKLVPDDQDAGVVAVEVDRVARVVHAVMRRRVEN